MKKMDVSKNEQLSVDMDFIELQQFLGFLILIAF